MGARKKLVADARKEAKKLTCEAKAVAVPTSPRKMRLLADILRGKDILDALNILTFSTKHASKTVEKLLRSAIANWEQKFNAKADESELFIKEIKVDERLDFINQYRHSKIGRTALKVGRHQPRVQKISRVGCCS